MNMYSQDSISNSYMFNYVVYMSNTGTNIKCFDTSNVLFCLRPKKSIYVQDRKKGFKTEKRMYDRKKASVDTPRESEQTS